MLILSNLYKLRCATGIQRPHLSAMTGIDAARIERLEHRSRKASQVEPWFDEGVALANVLTRGSLWELVAPDFHTQVQRLSSQLLPHDLDHWRAGRRVPLSLAFRVAEHFGLADPSELVVTPYQMQLWSMMEAGERNLHAYGICPWCGVDRFPTSGGRAEHEPWCAPNNMWGPKKQPTQLEPLKPMHREAERFLKKASRIAHGLKHWRVQAGLTQKQVAAQVGCTPEHLARIEQTRLRCTEAVAQKIAAVLEVSVEEIYTGV